MLNIYFYDIHCFNLNCDYYLYLFDHYVIYREALSALYIYLSCYKYDCRCNCRQLMM